MGDTSLFQRPENILRYEQELLECKLVDEDPVRIYSTSGELLREYPFFCEIEIPESDRQVIRQQIMIQCHESDVSFTKKDLQFAAEYRFSEIRLIGRSYIYSMKTLDRDWPDPGILGRKYDEIDTSADLVDTLERIRNSPDLRENSWDPEVDVLKIRNDMICKKIADAFCLDYRKSTFIGCCLHPKW